MVLKANWIKDEILVKFEQFEIVDMRRRSHL
jgi:hypothetical protein